MSNTNCEKCLELRIEYRERSKPFVFCSEDCGNKVFPESNSDWPVEVVNDL